MRVSGGISGQVYIMLCVLTRHCSSIGDSIKRSVCDPLIQFKDLQRKEVKALRAPVDKQVKALQDVEKLDRTLKRTAFTKSKEVEQANMAVDESRHNKGTHAD